MKKNCYIIDSQNRKHNNLSYNKLATDKRDAKKHPENVGKNKIEIAVHYKRILKNIILKNEKTAGHCR